MEKNCKRFNSFVAAFNSCYNQDVRVVITKPAVALTNAWLAGFTDAGGYFTVSIVDRPVFKNQYQVHARFILAQKDAEKELKALSVLLNGKVSFQKSYGGHSLSVQLTYLKVVLRYFRLFPLKTIKRVALIKFLAIYKQLLETMTNKKPFSPDELRVVKKRAKEINKIENLVEDKVRSIK